MIHLKKQVKSGELDRMSCVNSPFIKGRLLGYTDFVDAMDKGKRCCKKCKRVAAAKKNLYFSDEK